VVPELGGTTTVVAFSLDPGLPAQPQSKALSINKLDTTFIFVSSFNRWWLFREPTADPSHQPDMDLPRK